MFVDLEDSEFSFLPKKQSQRSRKKSFKQTRTTAFDKTPFEKLDLLVPETKDEADMVEGTLLHDLQRILKVSSFLHPADRFSRSLLAIPGSATGPYFGGSDQEGLPWGPERS